MKRTPLLRRSPLRPAGERRLDQSALYRFRRKVFLDEHPYCQVWLNEHGISEAGAIQARGLVRLKPDSPSLAVPLATEIHHRNKRRQGDLLDQSHWLAVSAEAHRQIENDKTWARDRGYLLPF